jgi:sugar phosphate isomerase/epimerase
MVSFSVASMFFHEYTCQEIFSFVSRAGLDAMEFWLETPDFWLRDQPVDELITCRKNNPELKAVTLHAPILDLNPCSFNPTIAQVSVEYAIQSIRTAEQIGADLVTVHPGRRTAKRPPTPMDFVRFDQYIRALQETTKESPVRIAIENMEPAINSMLCTPERMREVLDDEPWLMFTLDVAHALTKDSQEPARYIELCHDRLVNVHISRLGNGKPHFPLHRDPGMAGVMEMLADKKFSGTLTLEIEDLNFDRVFSAEEKIAVLAQDCAFMHDCMV